MFGKSDFKTGFQYVIDGIILSGLERRQFPRPEWQGKELVLWQEYNKRAKGIETKLGLILDHLNLEYVSETEKKEPAKLVEKKNVWDKAMTDLCFAISGGGCTPATAPKKKKRGRPKKK